MTPAATRSGAAPIRMRFLRSSPMPLPTAAPTARRWRRRRVGEEMQRYISYSRYLFNFFPPPPPPPKMASRLRSIGAQAVRRRSGAPAAQTRPQVYVRHPRGAPESEREATSSGSGRSPTSRSCRTRATPSSRSPTARRPSPASTAPTRRWAGADLLVEWAGWLAEAAAAAAEGEAAARRRWTRRAAAAVDWGGGGGGLRRAVPVRVVVAAAAGAARARRSG